MLTFSKAKESFSDYKIQVLIHQQFIDPQKINFNQEYQRLIEEPRWKPIYNSIISYGFWPFMTVIVNEEFEAVDGQHRVVAATKAGVKKIPICQVKFPSKDIEAKFFTDVNNYNTKLKTIDFWAAKKLAGDPLAVLVYRLEEDKRSLFHNNIAIKGKETVKSKWAITNTIEAVIVALGRHDSWMRSRHESIAQIAYNTPYVNVLEEVNNIVHFYEYCFGTKKENKVAHQKNCCRAILTFYLMLKRNGKHKDQATLDKMKMFHITGDFLASPMYGKIMALVNHYNHKRKKDRIEYKT